MGPTDAADGAAALSDGGWPELLAAVLSAADRTLTESLRRIAAAACQIVDCRCGVICAYRADRSVQRRVVAGTAPPDSDPDAPLPYREAAMLGLPVFVDGVAMGALYLYDRPDGSAFSEDDERLARMIAAAAADVFRRARATRASDQRQRWLAESADLTRELLSGRHSDPLRLVIERIWDVADADLIAVATERSDGDTYVVLEAAGVEAAELRGAELDPEQTFAGTVIAEGRARVVPDLTAVDEYSKLADVVGAKAALFAPLRTVGAERGMLAIFRRPDRPAFTAADVEAAATFGAQVTLALQLADTRTQWEHGVLLDERGRIARDLHDHVIQRLFAIGLTVHNVSAQLDTTTGRQLLDSVDALDETISQIRSTIYRLTGPLVSSDSSIRTRVVRLVDDLEPVLGFGPELEIKGPVDFGVDEEITDDCIAVLREALTNVARHAGASRVYVVLSATTNELSLEVTDDGKGMGEVTRRSGLANMRTRAERRGGRLLLDTAQPHGTRLTWTVPIGDQDRTPPLMQP